MPFTITSLEAINVILSFNLTILNNLYVPFGNLMDAPVGNESIISWNLTEVSVFPVISKSYFKASIRVGLLVITGLEGEGTIAIVGFTFESATFGVNWADFLVITK